MFKKNSMFMFAEKMTDNRRDLKYFISEIIGNA